MSKKTRYSLLKGAAATIPLALGAAPVGALFGALVVAYGYSPLFAIAMSVFVFAGSAQFIVIGLMAVGTPLFVILLTTFIVNLRHVLYSITLVPHIKKEALWLRAIMAFGLTDESFAVAAAGFEKKNISFKHYYLGSFVFFYSLWILSTVLGAYLGMSFPELKEMRLEIAMFVTFIGMTMPYLKTKPMIIACLVTAVSSVALISLPYNSGLIVSSLLGVIAGASLYFRGARAL